MRERLEFLNEVSGRIGTSLDLERTIREVTSAAVPRLLRGAGLEVLAHGETDQVMTEYRADGSRIDLPSQWLVLGRTG